MVRAGSGNGVFRQRSLVFLPLEYQRFCQVMQCLGSDYDVMADIAVEQAGVGIVNAFGNLQVGRGMGSKAARISMVACIAAAGCGIERLRQAAVVRRHEVFQRGFAAVEKACGNKFVINGAFAARQLIIIHKGRHGVVDDIHSHACQRRVLNGFNSVFNFLVRKLYQFGIGCQRYSVRQIVVRSSFNFSACCKAHAGHIQYSCADGSTGGKL